MRSLLPVLLLMPFSAAAVDISSSGIRQEDSAYSVHVDAYIDAPLSVVRAAITNFENLAAINPSFEESSVLIRTAELQRVRTVVNVCILVFCKRIVQVQDVRMPDAYTIRASMVPGISDFRSGEARWLLQEQDGGTQLHFSHVFEPDFWVPPLIGPWMIERKLVEEVEVTAHHIEQQARKAVPE
jgi:hypothetical protein